MDWHQIPLADAVVEAAAVVGEAEFVLAFTEEAKGVFRMTVYEDLRAVEPDARFFARAVEREDSGIQGLATAAAPEDAAALCLREAGTSLRRARGR